MVVGKKVRYGSRVRFVCVFVLKNSGDPLLALSTTGVPRTAHGHQKGIVVPPRHKQQTRNEKEKVSVASWLKPLAKGKWLEPK